MKHITFTLDQRLVEVLYKYLVKQISPDPAERAFHKKLNYKELAILREIIPILEERLTELHPEEPDPTCYSDPASLREAKTKEAPNPDHTRRREAQDLYLRDFNSILATFGGEKPGR